MRRTTKLLLAAGIVASILVPATAAAAAGPKFAPLALANGWTGLPDTAEPGVALISNVVTFRGLLTNGTSPTVFTLPAADTPATAVYVSVDLCDADTGRLFIQPSGAVEVEEADGVFSEAQCAIPLDGVSFTLTEKGAKPLTLLNGWTNAPFGTSNAAVRVVGGVVRLQGAIANGTENQFATLPKADWPKATVIQSIDLCNATHGALEIGTDGTLSVFSTGPFTPDAQCFTSLDGVSYVKADSAANAKAVALQNEWRSVWPARPAGLKVSGKVVRLEGAVSSGISPLIFTLPTKDRPAADVYVEAVSCGDSTGGGGQNALLSISHSTGEVMVVSPGSGFADAAECTYFDGSWFAQ
ncbi:MAG TPA: hypothetical protein VGH01_07920 [Jatrophihabitantaceae bacterium]|jgi:hypothetical protein